MYTQVAEKWLANEGTLTDVQREFLEKALAFYTQLPQDADADPAVLHESRQALSRVAALYNALGRHEQAVKSYQDLIAKCRADLQRVNDASARQMVLMDLVGAEGKFSHLYQQLGQFDAAKSLAATANQDAQPLLAQETALGDPDDQHARLINSLASTLLRADRIADATQVNKRAQQVWDTLATRAANSIDTRLGWVNARITQGDLVESGFGDRQQAEAALREADQKLSALCAAHPENRELRFKLVTVLERLRQLCWNANRKTEAIAFNGRAIPVLEKLVQEFPEDRYYLQGLVGFRQSQHCFGLDTQVSAAELAQLKQQWYAAARTQMERFPRFFASQQQLVHSSWWLGYSLSGAGKYAEARAVTREVMASIPFTSLSTDGDKKGTVLVVELAQLSALHATLELQLGDYIRAADFLRNLPDVYRTYAALSSVQLPEGWSEEDHPDTLAWVAASFGHTLEECALRAEQDETLGPDERSFRAAEYRAQAALRSRHRRAACCRVRALEKRSSPDQARTRRSACGVGSRDNNGPRHGSGVAIIRGTTLPGRAVRLSGAMTSSSTTWPRFAEARKTLGRLVHWPHQQIAFPFLFRAVRRETSIPPPISSDSLTLLHSTNRIRHRHPLHLAFVSCSC